MESKLKERRSRILRDFLEESASVVHHNHLIG